MKILLSAIICSVVMGECLPPHTFPKLYEDMYTCMLDGYTVSREKMEQIGQEAVNENELYIKFYCKDYTVPEKEKPTIDADQDENKKVQELEA